jgi:formiminotetrahydrofolate cyclodeaminase
MVCGITARHLESAPALAEIGADADRLRRRLATLVDADVEAYQRVLDARRLSPEARGPSLRDALGRATEVPLEVARAGATLLAHGAALVEQARASTVSDLGVAAALAWAALEAGALTARANLATLDDAAAGVATGRELDALTAQGTALRGRVAEAVARRAVGGGPRPR